ncbi:DNA polymerase III subunit psi [Salmonella enterica]
MTSRRDWQLQQLGITQWALRRPGALQGEIAISLPAHVRLIVVAEELPALNEPLMRDILRALTVSPDQVLSLAPERVAMLPQGSRCNSWRLGTDAPLQLEGAQVTTPAFNELWANPAARAALWQQICEHEHDFYPQHDRSPRSLAD